MTSIMVFELVPISKTAGLTSKGGKLTDVEDTVL